MMHFLAKLILNGSHKNVKIYIPLICKRKIWRKTVFSPFAWTKTRDKFAIATKPVLHLVMEFITADAIAYDGQLTLNTW
jgi:hypothetical protein